MSERDAYEQPFADEGFTALDAGSRPGTKELTTAERDAVLERGSAFAEEVGGPCLLLSGRFTSGNGESTESRLEGKLLRVLGHPNPDEPVPTISVLLNSPGGNLDAAYTTVLYLSSYTKELRVYVADRAKSASTLVALGADRLYMSAFGELGPLDTQLPDPRNPATTVSALDCYQSVDYVRNFGFRTIGEVLPRLVSATERRIPVNALVGTATTFALGAVTPMLQSVSALDFGGWGRSLRIGEHYARKILAAKSHNVDPAGIDRIAYQLVYGYTHHLFPIDRHEARRIGLSVEEMTPIVYDKAIKVLKACGGKSFVGFLSKEHAARETDEPLSPSDRSAESGGDGPDGRSAQDGHPQAEVDRPGPFDPKGG